jgi:hypothetical protein
MKIAGIFRGFPGLGRVVAGVEILEYFRVKFNADIRMFSYLQGEAYLRQKGYCTNFEVQIQDYSSIGIIPISSYGEYIINQISEFAPDIIVVDGEPLMIQSLKLTFSNMKIVSLLNPFDVENPYNQPSSSKYLRKLYSYADVTLVHGLWKVEAPEGFQNLHSINTIIRGEVLSIKPTITKNKISCILGGGTVNSKKEFLQKSTNIVEQCIKLAAFLPDYEIHIFCGCNDLVECINNAGCFKNVIIHSNIENSNDYYSDSKLIITRAGRNTISEILYLGIPTIVIPAGCNFRAKEQITNIAKAKLFNNGCFIALYNKFDSIDLSIVCREMITQDVSASKKWKPGNEEAIDILLTQCNLQI